MQHGQQGDAAAFASEDYRWGDGGFCPKRQREQGSAAVRFGCHMGGWQASGRHGLGCGRPHGDAHNFAWVLQEGRHSGGYGMLAGENGQQRL